MRNNELIGNSAPIINNHEHKKALIEGLPHLKPFIWGAFSPNPHKSLTSDDCRNIVGGYIRNINQMAGGHQYGFFVDFPDNLEEFKPRLHGHFVGTTNIEIRSDIYRRARRKTYGYFMVKKYDFTKYGIVYMYQNHREVRLGDIFCRDGDGCREKHIHREYHDALNRMYSIW